MEKTERKKPGPKKRIHEPRDEYHLKFTGDVSNYIKSVATNGYQAYFDELVRRDMQEHQEREKQ